MVAKGRFDLAEALPWWEALSQIEGSRGDG